MKRSLNSLLQFQKQREMKICCSFYAFSFLYRKVFVGACYLSSTFIHGSLICASKTLLIKPWELQSHVMVFGVRTQLNHISRWTHKTLHTLQNNPVSMKLDWTKPPLQKYMRVEFAFEWYYLIPISSGQWFWNRIHFGTENGFL